MDLVIDDYRKNKEDAKFPEHIALEPEQYEEFLNWIRHNPMDKPIVVDRSGVATYRAVRILLKGYDVVEI